MPRKFVMGVLILAGCAKQEAGRQAADSTSAPAPAAEAPAAPAKARSAPTPTGPARIESVEWEWVKTISSADSTWTPPNPDRFTLVLEGGQASGSADCNRFTGPYTLSGRTLTFGALATTRAACAPKSLGERYTRWLGQVTSQFTRKDTLFLELKLDSGTMVFVR